MFVVCTGIQKKHLYNFGLCLDRRSCCRFTCDGLFCARARERTQFYRNGKCQQNALPLGNCKSAASSSTISTGAWDICAGYFVWRILNSKAPISLLFTKYSRNCRVFCVLFVNEARAYGWLFFCLCVNCRMCRHVFFFVVRRPAVVSF